MDCSCFPLRKKQKNRVPSGAAQALQGPTALGYFAFVVRTSSSERVTSHLVPWLAFLQEDVGRLARGEDHLEYDSLGSSVTLGVFHLKHHASNKGADDFNPSNSPFTSADHVKSTHINRSR